VLIHSDREPIAAARRASLRVERAIAAHAAALIPEGATLQTGIGGIPDAVARILAERSGGDYGVHSEMFTTGLMHLHRAGKVTNRRKGLHDGLSICTFAMGTRALYDWLERRGPRAGALPARRRGERSRADRAQPSGRVDQRRALGRSRRAGGRRPDRRPPVLGIGGHEEFVTGAAFSEGGRSLICLPRRRAAKDGRSRGSSTAFRPARRSRRRATRWTW
jgi:acyl-CoA hydrolase